MFCRRVAPSSAEFANNGNQLGFGRWRRLGDYGRSMGAWWLRWRWGELGDGMGWIFLFIDYDPEASSKLRLAEGYPLQ